RAGERRQNCRHAQAARMCHDGQCGDRLRGKMMADTTINQTITPAPDGVPRFTTSTVAMLGASLFGGGGVAYLAFELLRDQPDKAFRLLEVWGPGYLLAFFVGLLLYRLLNRAVDVTMHSSQTNAAAVQEVAVQMRSVAEAMSAQAIALQKAADKDDNEKREMQILIGVLHDKVEDIRTEQKGGSRALQRIENALKINQPEGSDAK